jgi:hypothetical protein
MDKWAVVTRRFAGLESAMDEAESLIRRADHIEIWQMPRDWLVIARFSVRVN